jgi:hypothetical protein
MLTAVQPTLTKPSWKPFGVFNGSVVNKLVTYKVVVAAADCLAVTGELISNQTKSLPLRISRVFYQLVPLTPTTVMGLQSTVMQMLASPQVWQLE